MIARIRAWLTRVLAWLRRPAPQTIHAPVLVTPEGSSVMTLRQVPIRSSKADAKREALTFARTHFGDPTLTWGQARKRLAKLERELRAGGMAVEE